MRSFRCNSRGFTFIELLVVISIIFVLAVLSFSSFRQFAVNQQFDQLVEQVGNQLRLARQQTIASKDDTVYGVYVGINTVEFFASTTPTPGSPDNRIIDLSAGSREATSSLANGDWYVTFARVTGEPSATGTIIISDNTLGRTATYTIYQSGLVE